MMNYIMVGNHYGAPILTIISEEGRDFFIENLSRLERDTSFTFYSNIFGEHEFTVEELIDMLDSAEEISLEEINTIYEYGIDELGMSITGELKNILKFLEG